MRKKTNKRELMEETMKDSEIIKLCDNMFKNEIRRATINAKDFKFKRYERELYRDAIKSFKIGFLKALNKKFQVNKLNEREEKLK